MFPSARMQNAMMVRATTGQHLTIGYDRRTNEMVFIEDTWCADAVHADSLPGRVPARQVVSLALRRPARKIRRAA